MRFVVQLPTIPVPGYSRGQVVLSPSIIWYQPNCREVDGSIWEFWLFLIHLSCVCIHCWLGALETEMSIGIGHRALRECAVDYWRFAFTYVLHHVPKLATPLASSTPNSVYSSRISTKYRTLHCFSITYHHAYHDVRILPCVLSVVCLH